MRPGEIALLGVSGLALLLAARRVAPATRLVVSGLGLLALALHATVEGLRWQLAPAYLVVLVLAVHALLRARVPLAARRLPRGLAIVTGGGAAVLLLLSAGLAYALPVFALPPLTGDAAVGVQYFALVDERRPDPFLAPPSRPRELLIKVYYPGQPDAARPPAPYFDGSTDLTRALATFYGLPAFAFDHLTLVRAHAKAGLAVASAQQPYPVVLFSHGAGTSLEVATAQAEDLASHGYVVVTLDHPYVSAATVLPDRVVTAREATASFDTPEPAEPITAIMADDARFVVDVLGEMNAGRRASPFAGQLDLDHIGAIGHSVGGAVAYHLALTDPRIKAAINLDGAVYVTPTDPAAGAPFLMLVNDRYHVQALTGGESLMQHFDATPEGQQAARDLYGSPEGYAAALAKAESNADGLAQVLKRSGTLYTIAGSDHMKFADIALFIGSARLRELLQIGGATPPARCLEIAAALTVAFFDQHLKGLPAALLSDTTAYPELRRVPLP